MAVARLGPGDFFGEVSLITGEPRNATVVAQKAVDAYVLGKTDFEAALAAREKSRFVTDPVAEPEALQNVGAAPPYFIPRSISELRRHLDVLVGGKRVEQIVHLKDEANVAPHID